MSSGNATMTSGRVLICSGESTLGAGDIICASGTVVQWTRRNPGSPRVVQPATLVVLFGLRADQDAVVETLQ